MTVMMLTEIGEESIVYTVSTDSGESLVWRKEVPFGMSERFHAGGAAFVAAAREQATVAEIERTKQC